MDPCSWPGVSSVCESADDALGSFVEDGAIRILGGIAQGVTEFAAFLLEVVWMLIAGVTTPQTDGEFLQQWASMIFAIALPITVMFMVFQIIGSIIRARGPNRTGITSAVSGAAMAVIGTAVSLPVIHGATRLVDGAADAMSAAILGDIDTLGDSFATAIGGDGVGLGELLTQNGQNQLFTEAAGGVLGALVGLIAIGLLMIAGGIAVFAALLIRTLLLYVVVVTGPIAFLGLVWEPARGWFRRWCVAVIALIFTKLGVVVVFGLGISALNSLDFGGGLLETLGRLLAGALLLLIAALVPIMAFKFFDFLGEEAAAPLHAGAQASVARGREVAGRMDPRRVADRLHSGNGSPNSGGGRGGQPARQQPGRGNTGGQPTPPPQPGGAGAQPGPGGGGSGPSQPWTSSTKPGTGQPGNGWSRPAPAGTGATSRSAGGGAAAGGAAGAAGAVVGAGTVAGQAAASTGSKAGQQAAQQRPAQPPPAGPPRSSRPGTRNPPATPGGPS